jgi:hypothetical protein
LPRGADRISIVADADNGTGKREKHMRFLRLGGCAIAAATML